MAWINIKKELPIKIPEWYLHTHDTGGEVSCLVYGYDSINFYPRYEVVHINDVAEVKTNVDGEYILNELIMTHWMKIERPI